MTTVATALWRHQSNINLIQRITCTFAKLEMHILLMDKSKNGASITTTAVCSTMTQFVNCLFLYIHHVPMGVSIFLFVLSLKCDITTRVNICFHVSIFNCTLSKTKKWYITLPHLLKNEGLNIILPIFFAAGQLYHLMLFLVFEIPDWSLNKLAFILETTLWYIFSWRKLLYFHYNFIEM